MAQGVAGDDFALAALCARLAGGGDEQDWTVGARLLADLDGRGWLRVDSAARRITYPLGSSIPTATSWLPEDVTEPSGFVAAVTSWHGDGRIRERATRILGVGRGNLRAAALSVRLLDPVPQVRAAAVAGLAEYVPPDQAAASVAIALAGRDRLHGPAALVAIQGILRSHGLFEPAIGALLNSQQTAERRWAYATAYEERMLTAEMLFVAVRGERDQFLRAQCARWLAEVAGPEELSAMLAAGLVEARLAALRAVSEGGLSDELLLTLLVDRSPRVRQVARVRATRRGIGTADWYTQRLAAADSTPAVKARCLDALVTIGAADADFFRSYSSHGNATVRAAAVECFGYLASPRQVVDTLTPLLLDPSPKVCKAATRVLNRAGGTGVDVAAAWNSSQRWSRAAAWRLSRAGGSWDRVEADLRAGVDVDATLSANGVAGIFDWLVAGAATTWAPLADDQRQRIAEYLERSQLGDAVREKIAFHAGISRPTAAPRDPVPQRRHRAASMLRFIRGRRS